MFFYFILFCVIGMILGYLCRQKNHAIILAVILSLIWGLAFRFWAIITFLELMAGIFIALKIKPFLAPQQKKSVSIKGNQKHQENEEDEVIDIPFTVVREQKPRPEPLPPRIKTVTAAARILADNIILTDEFKQALDLLEHSNGNVFVTGNAGTGKSTLLSIFRKNTKKNIVILAPTGIAALNIEGATIHSFFHFPLTIIDKNNECLKEDNRRKLLFKNLDAIIIDEISMVRADILDAIDIFLKNNRYNDSPFGGVQMILFGDPLQLAPVIDKKDKAVLEYLNNNYNSPYFFDAKAYKSGNFKFLELKRIFRQKDDEFIRLLNAVRKNIYNDNDLIKLNYRYTRTDPLQTVKLNLTLCTTNKIADGINKQHLDNIQSPAYFYDATTKGIFKEKFPAESCLELKKGAQVMLLKNDAEKRWVNGTLATIYDLDHDFIEIDIDGCHYYVQPASWRLIEYKYDKTLNKINADIVGEFIQYPLKAAWAITIHKSQGQTFDNINIDLGRGAFTHGQTYVALSRCSHLEGITLLTRIKKSDIQVDRRVVNFLDSSQGNVGGTGFTARPKQIGE